MASLKELNEAVRETLENRGVLDQLRARIRAEVFSALDDPTDTKCEVSRENVIINELIREYLEYNRYRYTASVFSSETQLPPEPLDRKFLAHELNVSEDRSTAAVPLLYSIVDHFTTRSRRPQPYSADSGVANTGPDDER